MAPDLARHEADLRQESFLLGLVQVGPEGLVERLLPLLDGAEELTEHLLAETQVAGGTGGVILALELVQLVDARGIGVGHNYRVAWVVSWWAWRPVKWFITV